MSEEELDPFDVKDLELPAGLDSRVMAAVEHSHKVERGNPFASACYLAYYAFERVHNGREAY